MCHCCVPTEDDRDYDYHENRRYIIITFITLLPNFCWLIFGTILGISSLDPGPTHEFSGPGGEIDLELYCYWGLWALFHVALIASSALIIIATIHLIVGICLHCKDSESNTFLERQESSWNGSKRYITGRKRSNKPKTAPSNRRTDPYGTQNY
jgi:hypothetical protein